MHLDLVVSHIQRIGFANPKKQIYTVANPARGPLNREEKNIYKVWQRIILRPIGSFYRS